MIAASASCTPELRGALDLLTWIFVAGLFAVLALAYSYPRNPRRLFAKLGGVLAATGVLIFLSSLGVAVAGHRDDCGKLRSATAGWMTALFLGGLIVVAIGLALRTGTEWAPMLLVAVVDAGLAGWACAGLFGRQDRLVAVLFGTHGLCIAIASWWSWRARGRKALPRAKASEAGRLLEAGLVAVVLLQVASSGQPTADQVLTNSNLAGALIVTALAIALGTGYTKYVEAMQEDLIDEQPRSDFPPAMRSAALSLARTYRATAARLSKARGKKTPPRPRTGTTDQPS